jgi:hypothetical protein
MRLLYMLLQLFIVYPLGYSQYKGRPVPVKVRVK